MEGAMPPQYKREIRDITKKNLKECPFAERNWSTYKPMYEEQKAREKREKDNKDDEDKKEDKKPDNLDPNAIELDDAAFEVARIITWKDFLHFMESIDFSLVRRNGGARIWKPDDTCPLTESKAPMSIDQPHNPSYYEPYTYDNWKARFEKDFEIIPHMFYGKSGVFAQSTFWLAYKFRPLTRGFMSGMGFTDAAGLFPRCSNFKACGELI
jgi:hypothetical protein